MQEKKRFILQQRLRWSTSSVLAFGSHPAEAVGFLGRKNSQHAFLRRGSKAVRRSHVVALRQVKDP